MTRRTVEHATCLGCGCACDDIAVVVDGDRIAEARNSCPLGRAWFADGSVPRETRSSGKTVAPDVALADAAKLLGRAERPLVYLAPDISCETQRAAVAVADRLGALLDSPTAEVAAGILASQRRGRAGATLGETRQGAHPVVFWGVDPADRSPRYASRYAVDPTGLQAPDGRHSRRVVAVDVGPSRGAADADERVAITPEDEVDALAFMRAVVLGRLTGDGTVARAATGLATQMMRARYVALVHDAEPSPHGLLHHPDRAEALIALAQALNGPARCALSSLRAGGNRSGADAVATWQTGFPFAVDFAPGYPCYRPHAGAAVLLGRGEIDVALLVGSPAGVPPAVAAALGQVTTIAIGPRASAGRDVCTGDGRIVAELPREAPKLDARGMVVMPGGVDIHSHIAGSSVNHGRRLLPEEHAADPAPAPRLADPDATPRSGTGGTIPSSFTTGYRYAGLGYTTAMEAAVAPLAARHAHCELDDTPIIDAGLFALLGNDDYLLRQIAAGEAARARDYAAWVLSAAGGYAIKIVNPGGVERWKAGGRNVTGLDDAVGTGAVTPRRILETLADAANALELPHPVHIHCNNLGQAGNAATTLETMRALAGRRAHFTHLQFHSYGGEPGKSWKSAAKEVIEHVNAHPEVSADVGQVMFGPATTLTADAPVEYLLHASSGKRWVNVDIELETGCGIVPYSYKEQAAVAALQWAIGLELFLLAQDPWRVVLSTDHPNGGSFLSYPELIRLLMDRGYRDERLKQVNQKLVAGSALADGLAREYTLSEIAIVTRAGPARVTIAI